MMHTHMSQEMKGENFDSKSRKCIMVGYGMVTKGYRLYDPTDRKILHSRDVQFNERSKDRGPNTQEVFDTDYRLIAEFSETSDTESNFDATQVTQPKVDEELNSEAPRRSTRQRKQPDFYGKEMSNVSEIAHSPTSYQEATEGPNKNHWEAAMKTEMMSLKENDVWDFVKLPADKKTVGSKWVYKIKTGEDGSIQRYKARLVAQGFTQKYGADFDETFCPVVRQESLRLFDGIISTTWPSSSSS